MTESLHLMTMAGLWQGCGMGRVFTTPVVSLNSPEGVLVVFMRCNY